MVLTNNLPQTEVTTSTAEIPGVAFQNMGLQNQEFYGSTLQKPGFQSTNAQQPDLGSNLSSFGTNLQNQVTTSNIGINPLAIDQNIIRHEQKVINNEQGEISDIKVINLAQHEVVMDTLNRSTGQTTSLGANLHVINNPSHRKGFNDPFDDDSQKPGFIQRVKGKLHLKKM
jgi:hypothetical protein